MTSLQAQSFSLQGVSMSPHKARRQRTESFKELKICPFLAQRIILKLWIHSCGSLHLVTGTPQASSIQDIFSTTIPLASTLLWWWRRYIREAVFPEFCCCCSWAVLDSWVTAWGLDHHSRPAALGMSMKRLTCPILVEMKDLCLCSLSSKVILPARWEQQEISIQEWISHC